MENLKEIVSLAFKQSPSETEYYLNKYLYSLENKEKNIRNEIIELSLYSENNLLEIDFAEKQSVNFISEINKLKMHLTSLKIG